MDPKTFENLNVMVAGMMREKNVKGYEIILGGNSKLGDGYIGEIISFQIICRQRGMIHYLIMKSAGRNEVFREVTLLKSVFDREAFMYETVFPAVRSHFQEGNFSFSFPALGSPFQERNFPFSFSTSAVLQRNCRVLDNIPKLYVYSGEFLKEAFIFEDLKQQGYSMWPRGKIVDLNSTLVVLRNLAKWHGTFMAFRDQNPEQFQEWIPQLSDVRYNVLERVGLLKHAHIIYEEVLNLFRERGEHGLLMKYNKYKGKLDELFKPAAIDDRLVIVHGDAWINNIMFKLGKNEGKPNECKLLDFRQPFVNAPVKGISFFEREPSECKLLDFQQSFVNTPVDDISFFIYTSCDQTVLDKIDDLLHEYYSTLFQTVKVLGSDLNKIFTFEQLQEHWKKYAILGVVMSIEIVKLQNLSEDEVPNLRKICESGETDFSNYYFMPMKRKKAYFNRLLTVFSHYGNRYL